MYDNKSAIQEAKQFIEMHFARKSIYEPREVHENGVPLEWIAKSSNWATERIDYERDFGVGTEAQQREWFDFLLEIARDARLGGTHSLSRFMLINWAGKSQNLFATGYREGQKDGKKTGILFAERMANLKAKTVIRTRISKAASGRRKYQGTSCERGGDTQT